MSKDKNNTIKLNTKPIKKYRTILADPPWDINQRGNYGAVNHYDLMSLERIKSMPIQDLCDENSHLWLWVTNGTLQHAFEVLEAWGFTYRNIFTWVKPRFGRIRKKPIIFRKIDFIV